MIEIQTTEYLRPDGRTLEKLIYLPDESKEAYDRMIAAGYWIALEQLNPKQTAVWIEDSKNDLDCRIALPYRLVNTIVEILDSNFGHEQKQQEAKTDASA